VRAVVDKSGSVTHAKALSGPPELFQASVDAAKQWQFEPPERAPITTDLEIKYGLGPKPCPPGKKGSIPTIEFGLHYSTDHPGELKILGELDVPSPPYPEKAKESGIEGDLELFITVARSGEVVGTRVVKSVDPDVDEAALATVRTWKFKVSRGEQAGFPVKFLFRLTCAYE
jgi:TonB family protein